MRTGDRCRATLCNVTRVCLVGRLVAPAIFVATACGDTAEESGFDLPQIVPDTNVLCLSYEPVDAGSVTQHFVQFTNRGRDDLTVEGGSVQNDLRSSFTVDAVVNDADVPCQAGQPCTLRTGQNGFLQFSYAPSNPGWDATDIRIRSNAQNYPNLRIFVLGLATPPNANNYDPGEKPDVARSSDGNETCP